MDGRDTKSPHSVAPLHSAAATSLLAETSAALTAVTPVPALLSLQAEVAQLRRALGEARQRIGALERLADEDPLMPVANRRAFLREVRRMIAFARRYQIASSVAFFDLDGMKCINDAHGHAAGDAALLQVGRLLVANVRASDVVGRLGGDEFGVLLVQADAGLAAAKAADLAATVAAQPLVWLDGAIPLSLSYGVHAFDGATRAEEALDAADRAMYLHKDGRRGGVRPGVEPGVRR